MANKSKPSANKAASNRHTHDEDVDRLPQPMNSEQQRVYDWLRAVKFKKMAFGGVDEADVWKKIGELNALYDAALCAERVRYDTLLEQAYAAQQSAPNTWKDGDGYID